MPKLDYLIEKLCPNGVEFKPLWSLTVWDKRFNGIDKDKQKKVISYKYYLSTDFNKVEREKGDIKYIPTGIAGKDRYTTEELARDYIAEGEIVCIPWGGTPNVKYHKGRFVTGDNRIATSLDINTLDNKFLYYWLQSNIGIISTFYRGSGIKHPRMKDVLDMRIPIPPLEVQHEIVHILDNFTLLSAEISAEISAEMKARQRQYEYYFDKILNHNEYPKMKLGNIGQVRMCKRILKSQTNNVKGIPFYKIGTFGKKPDAYISEEIFREYKSKYFYPRKGDILISCSGTIGRTVIFDGEPAYFQDSNIVWLEHDGTKVINEYLFYCYKTNPWMISTGGTISRLYNENVLKAEIPVPPVDEQIKIVNKLNRFYKICNDISEGLPAEIEARQKQYEYYRDKLLSFKELKQSN